MTTPDAMTCDDWDEVYMDCESNGDGQPRSMVRYAYEAGYEAATKAAIARAEQEDQERAERAYTAERAR